jgi:hypothetical protein
VDSYIRRQTWLQQQQAVQVINAYAEAMGGNSKGDSKRGRGGKPAATSSKKVGGNDLLGMMKKRTA